MKKVLLLIMFTLILVGCSENVENTVSTTSKESVKKQMNEKVSSTINELADVEKILEEKTGYKIELDTKSIKITCDNLEFDNIDDYIYEIAFNSIDTIVNICDEYELPETTNIIFIYKSNQGNVIVNNVANLIDLNYDNDYDFIKSFYDNFLYSGDDNIENYINNLIK